MTDEGKYPRMLMQAVRKDVPIYNVLRSRGEYFRRGKLCRNIRVAGQRGDGVVFSRIRQTGMIENMFSGRATL